MNIIKIWPTESGWEKGGGSFKHIELRVKDIILVKLLGEVAF